MTALTSVPRETPLDDGSHYQRTIGEILVESIDVGPNVRVDPGELDELTASIQQLGVLQPIKIRQVGDRWSVVWGQRRLLAARQAGLERIPAIIEAVEQTPARTSIEQLSENLQRKDLNPIEEAVALRAVLDADPALTQEALGEQLGRSRSWVANTLGLLKAPETVQMMVRTGVVSAAHVKAVAGLEADLQETLVARAVEGEHSAHDLERSAKWERERVAEREKNRKRSEAAAKRAIKALEAAKLPPLAPIYVATPWTVDSDIVRKAITTAGFAIAEGWGGHGPRPTGCDCMAFRVDIAEGEGTKVVETCVSDAHREAQEEIRRAEAKDRQTAQERDQAEIRKAVLAALKATPGHPTVLRLLVRAIDGYTAKKWSDYAGMTDVEVLEQLARRASMGSTYGSPALPAKSVLAALASEPSAPKPKPARTRKAAAE